MMNTSIVNQTLKLKEKERVEESKVIIIKAYAINHEMHLWLRLPS